MKVALEAASTLAGAYAQVRATPKRSPGHYPPKTVSSVHEDASPVKWHLAHTSWFFESVILADRPSYRPFDSRFAYLFNS